MELVVDANILISGLIKDGITRELPLREDFTEKIKSIWKGKFQKYSSIEELRKDIEGD